MKIYDISHPVGLGVAVWPGDTPFASTWNLRLQDGHSVNLSDLRLSAHTGTHADAPLHFDAQGCAIDTADLTKYVGPARVVHVGEGSDVRLEDVQPFNWRHTPRCLLRTGSCPRTDFFNTALMPISVEAAGFLARQGIHLVGTDAHSVDAYESKELPVHHLLGRSGVAILENLNLDDVPAGEYWLIALPLRLVGLEASPVRAILLDLPPGKE